MVKLSMHRSQNTNPLNSCLADEFSCQLVSVDDSYIKDFSPPPNKMTGEKATISTDLKILSVYSINEVDDEISVQVQLDITWRDSRLILNDLKPIRRMNTLTRDSIDKIWFPHIVFNNSRGRVSSVADEESLSMITRKGNYSHSSIQEINNRLIFKGADNPIVTIRIYEVNLSCHFNMGTYPFDSQKCHIILDMKGNGARFVDLVGQSVSYFGPVDLKRFYVEHVHLSNHTNEYSGLKHVSAVISFRRRLLSTIMTTYLPTVLLCAVCFSTTSFKSEYFEAAVTVNLTSLLVLTTFFIGVFNSLPQTSYIKMIDVWMVANLFIPFLEVLLVTLAENYRLDNIMVRVSDLTGNNRVGSKVSSSRMLTTVTRFSKVGLPLIYIIFVVIYFLVGMSIYNNNANAL